jgi:hypothetical protein
MLDARASVQPIGKAAQLSGGRVWAFEGGVQFCASHKGCGGKEARPYRAIVVARHAVNPACEVCRCCGPFFVSKSRKKFIQFVHLSVSIKGIAASLRGCV